jgi:flagellar hook-associated protein 1 FlgK
VPGIYDSLEIGKRALVAHQAALNTIGHNLANAATPGYTRQRAELSPVIDQGGVEVSGIRRIRDRYLDFSLMTESQTLGQYQANAGLLQRLQSIFNDPTTTGLGAMVNQFFQSFQDVSANPTDQALRVALSDNGNQLAGTFQGLWSRVDQLKTDLGTEIQTRVNAANGLLDQIADLHRQIQASGGGPAPNDLLDRRDNLVDQLNQIIGVSATDRPDGTVQLAVKGSGVLLVDGVLTAPLTATANVGTDSVDLTAGSVAVTPQGGELAAVMTARNSPTGAIKQATADLDSLARSIISEVNRVHTNGAGLTGFSSLTSVNAVSAPGAALTTAGLPFTPGSGSFTVIVHDATGATKSSVTVPVTAGVTTLNDIATALNTAPDLSASISGGKLTMAAGAGDTFAFTGDTSDTLMALGLNTFFAGAGARDMALNPVIAADANKIAAAQPDAAGLVHPGDGANALLMAGLATTLAMNGGTANFSDFFGTMIGGIGSEMRAASDAVTRQQAAVQVVQSLQQQASGVSTDEELISLTQSQTAYAAAARFIGTTQNIIDELLNMLKF